jgi:enoyl-CoA hydratase
MPYQNLLIANEGGIVTITINRPNALNALNQQTLGELYHFFEEGYLDQPELSGVIITGAGDKAFVAGADIKEFLGIAEAGRGEEMARNGQNVFFLIERFQRPVIAAVNGFALGGGCELAMACHMRVAGEAARFGQPEVNLGIIPGYGGTQRLPRLVGRGKALELMMTADIIGAEEAHRLGLADHLVPKGEEVAKAKEILAKIASKAPIAISKIIECVNAHYEVAEHGFVREAREFGVTAHTEDFVEGASAFVEKRKAHFKGR